jgi:hypothetical protein
MRPRFFFVLANEEPDGSGATTNSSDNRATWMSAVSIALFITSYSHLLAQGHGSSSLLKRDAFPQQLKVAADALGDRVVRPASERVISVRVFTKGTIQITVRIMHEMRDKLRFEELGAGSTRVVGFDGSSAWASEQLNGVRQRKASRSAGCIKTVKKAGRLRSPQSCRTRSGLVVAEATANRGDPTALTISRNYQRSRWKEFL